MWIGIGIGALAVVAVLSVLIARRPAAFRIERSTTVAAPAEAVFELINDLHHWIDWSPFEKRDPKMQRSYDGPKKGVGASYSWSGNREIGAGRMTITESSPFERIAIKLEFLKPFKATNEAVFAFRQSANGVSLTWSMSGKNNFMCKAMSLFMNMDKMVGKEFENGLAELKRQAESADRPAVALAGH
jgi:hypothetical protein